jgi:hypothetical protein
VATRTFFNSGIAGRDFSSLVVDHGLGVPTRYLEPSDSTPRHGRGVAFQVICPNVGGTVVLDATQARGLIEVLEQIAVPVR